MAKFTTIILKSIYVLLINGNFVHTSHLGNQKISNLIEIPFQEIINDLSYWNESIS